MNMVHTIVFSFSVECCMPFDASHHSFANADKYTKVCMTAIPCEAAMMQETHIIMEYCDCGSLDDALHRGVFHHRDASSAVMVNMDFVCRTLLDIAKGMEYLHCMRIFMRDLKPKNVLLASSMVRFPG
jgi:serine/threonine protein kinase